MLTIISNEKDSKNRVLCHCECGKEKMINIYNIKSKNTSSCGCLKKNQMKERAKQRFSGKQPSNFIDYAGKRIGFITVLKRVEDKKKWVTTYLLRCDCGTEFTSEISSLRRSKFNKCNCGYKKHPLKLILQGMIERCENKNMKGYEFYGGKGIKVCENWKKYPIHFIKWSLENGWISSKESSRKTILSIDRIDSNKDYTPENCQWITLSENSKKAMTNRWKK